MKNAAPLSLITAALLAAPVWAQEPKPAAPRQIQAPATIEKPSLKPAPKPEEPKKTLNVGDPAPEFKVEAFIKGEPVKSFEKGKVYVIEFWATWCGPCIMAFPHLSELQAEYKDKVTIIGTNSLQTPYKSDTIEVIKAFVAKQGDKMAYTVAYDGKEMLMANAYLTAAGQSSIPTAFIVNQEGKLAWVGHPGEMNDVLKSVVEGTYDLKAAAEKAKSASTNGEKIKEAEAKVKSASKASNWDEVVAGLDELVKLNPEEADAYLDKKFKILVLRKNDYAAAYAMKDALLAEPKIASNGVKLNEFAWAVVRPDSQIPQKERNLDFAMTFAAKADEVTKHEDSLIIDTLACVYWEKGDRAKAIEFQEKAVNAAENNAKIPQYDKDQLKTRLARYKKEDAKAGG